MAKLGSAPGAQLARFGAVLAIVFAILGMHGLSLHGAAAGATRLDTATPHSIQLTLGTPQERHQPLARAMAGPGSTLASGSDTAPSASPHDSDRISGDDGTGDSHTLRDMAMLCLATLVAALTLLALIRLVRSLPRVWATLLPAISNWHYRLLPPTGTGPPYTWRFSVIRC